MTEPRRLKALLSAPLVVLGALLFLFEEVLWGGLGRLMAALGRLPLVGRIEAGIRRLPPYAAMGLFLLPVAIILPVKLTALWLIARGRVPAGILLFVLGKIAGMAVLARLYGLCRDSLCSLGWFARLEAMLRRWSAWAHALLDRLPAWRRAKALVRLAVAAAKTTIALVRTPASR